MQKNYSQNPEAQVIYIEPNSELSLTIIQVWRHGPNTYLYLTHFVVPLHLQGWTHAARRSSASVAKQTQQDLAFSSSAPCTTNELPLELRGTSEGNLSSTDIVKLRLLQINNQKV